MIRKITPAGVVTTFAGALDSHSSTDGTRYAARFNAPYGIAVDAAGAVYVADTLNNAVRIGLPSIADAATVDNRLVSPGVARQLDTSARTATSWQWTIIRRPSGSNAVLSSTSIRNPTFTPDVADLYQIRLVATNANGSSITIVSIGNLIGRHRAVDTSP
jgi:streptogramin lyase